MRDANNYSQYHLDFLTHRLGFYSQCSQNPCPCAGGSITRGTDATFQWCSNWPYYACAATQYGAWLAPNNVTISPISIDDGTVGDPMPGNGDKNGWCRPASAADFDVFDYDLNRFVRVNINSLSETVVSNSTNTVGIIKVTSMYG